MKQFAIVPALLALLLTACGGLGGSTPRTALPAELVGTWSNGGVLDTN